MSRHHQRPGATAAATARRSWLACHPTRTCNLCGRPGADTVDHVVPLALGGADHPGNWQPAHRSCNSSAGATLGNQLRRPFTTSRAW